VFVIDARCKHKDPLDYLAVFACVLLRERLFLNKSVNYLLLHNIWFCIQIVIVGLCVILEQLTLSSALLWDMQNIVSNTNFLKKLVTTLADSMERSPSWEANSSSTSQEISEFYGTPKVHYRVHNSSLLLLILTQSSPGRHSVSLPSIWILPFHLDLVFQAMSFTRSFSNKTI